MQSSGISSPASRSATSSPAGRPRSRFALTGPSEALDPRTHALRRDLADIRLADRVFAPHYAMPLPRTAGRATPILAQAGRADTVLSQVLPGEPFDVLEVAGDHLWGMSPIDGAAGYVAADAFGAFWAPTHLVVAATAPVRADLARDSRILQQLPMGARVAAVRINDATMEVDGGYVDAACLRALDAPGDRPADVAERLIGTPAVTGGRSGSGVDAAGLVFLALSVAEIEAPRFRGDQAQEAGVALSDDAAPARHDLVFFAGHVAILRDRDSAVHVGDAAVERATLDALVQAHGPIVARRRP